MSEVSTIGGAIGDRRAFTLLELILVMTVLVVAVSVVAPSLSGSIRGRTLDLEARRLLALTHAGQSRAVSEGFPVLLWVDAQAGTYGMEEEATSLNADPKAMDFVLNGNLRISVPNAVSVSAHGHSLPAIRFLPDGSIDESSPGAVQVTGADGSVLWLVRSLDGANYEISVTSQL